MAPCSGERPKRYRLGLQFSAGETISVGSLDNLVQATDIGFVSCYSLGFYFVIAHYTGDAARKFTVFCILIVTLGCQ